MTQEEAANQYQNYLDSIAPGILQDDDSAAILDEEIDPVKLQFDPTSETVEINTRKYAYITFSVDHLHQILDLMEECLERYNNEVSREQ